MKTAEPPAEPAWRRSGRQHHACAAYECRMMASDRR